MTEIIRAEHSGFCFGVKQAIEKAEAAIEETSATMNETASMVARTAENTKIAAQFATDTTDAANKGVEEIKYMAKAMDELKDSSDKVSKIVKTIDNIASQTNILALNATVEAARAGGDAGRSFAIVAEEVRNLAQRSVEAAADTADIIERNATLTNTGQKISNEISVSFEEIIEKTNKLNKLISEIYAASEEQTSGVKQINIAINQMERVTQENAAVAEENAASSNCMREELANLKDAIDITRGLIKNIDEVNIT